MLQGQGDGLPQLVHEHLQRDDMRCCQPDPSAAAVYQETYNAYQSAVEHVAALYSTDQKLKRNSA